MTLNQPAWKAVSLDVRGQELLGVATGFAPDTMEGLRLVKVSRGDGWLVQGQAVSRWPTKGVVQRGQELVVWGDLPPPAMGDTVPPWNDRGPLGRDFVRALVSAWLVALDGGARLINFCPASVIPLATDTGWAFLFPPHELATVLDSLFPLSNRLGWEHLRHPELSGADSWGFGLASLCWRLAHGELPWEQSDEEGLRQELRELKRTLKSAEIPVPSEATHDLWYDSLTGRGGVRLRDRWKSWIDAGAPLDEKVGTEKLRVRRESLRKARAARRARSAFWSRRGTLLVVVSAVVLGLGSLIGSVIWGAVKPDPSDHWTPRQVVEGFYHAVDNLDSEEWKKLVAFDASREPVLAQEQATISNLFVVRQVRTAYEHHSPIVNAEEWVRQGRPPLGQGALLWGITGLETKGAGSSWTAHYEKWSSQSSENGVVRPEGYEVTDRLLLEQTGRGWKVHGLIRVLKPLS